MNSTKYPYITQLDILLALIVALLCVMLIQIKGINTALWRSVEIQHQIDGGIDDVNIELSGVSGVLTGKTGAAFTVNGEGR